MKEQRSLLLENNDEVYYIRHTDPDAAIPHTRIALVMSSTRLQLYRPRLTAALEAEMARIKAEESL